MDKEGVVEVRLISAPDDIEARVILRGLLGPADILEVIRRRDPGRTPVEVGHLFGLDHDAEASLVLECLADLNRSRVEFELLVEGEPESEEYLRNRIESFAGIREDIRREDELRSGDG